MKHWIIGIVYLIFLSNGLRAGILHGVIPQVHLEQINTRLITRDFMLDPSKLDSVRAWPDYRVTLSYDKQSMLVVPNGMRPAAVSLLRFWSKGKMEAVVLYRSRKQLKPLGFDAKGKSYKSVELAGDFNGWDPKKTPLKEEKSRNLLKGQFNKWIGVVELNPGKYAYQIVADGKWMTDPENKDSISNGSGGWNSVLHVGKSFDAMPVLFTQSFQGNSLHLGVDANRKPDTLLVLWNNTLLPAASVEKKSDGFIVLLDQSIITAPDGVLRVFGYNRIGACNDLMIFMEKGQVALHPTGGAFQAMSLYFVLVDRFANGSSSNDAPVQDAVIDPRANYMGGDLAGIAARIKDGYFDRLGINALWLSPIVENPAKGYVEYPEPHRTYSGYHGYWPISSTKIDPRLGNSADLHELVREAHARGMKVFLDFVSNHVHNEHPLYKQHPDWTTPIDLPDGRKNIRIWDEHRLTTWFDTFLPDLDYSKPQVVEAMTDSAVWWIKTYDLDGFRHDATKHVSEDFWRTLTYKLKTRIEQPTGKRIYQIGETFGSRELIASYVNSGEQDAQFDFNLYFDARSVFAEDAQSFQRLKHSLQETFSYYGTHHVMGNISGNHDLARFISYAGGGMQFSEDDRKVAWERKVGVPDARGYAKLLQLHAFNFSIPGIPVLYYGDEFGMPGAGDPDNRRMMRFDGLAEMEQRTLEATRKMALYREAHPALMLGDVRFLKVTDTEWVMLRSYFDQNVLVVLRKGKDAGTIRFTLPSELVGKSFTSMNGLIVNAKGNQVEIDLSADGYDFLEVK